MEITFTSGLFTTYNKKFVCNAVLDKTGTQFEILLFASKISTGD